MLPGVGRSGFKGYTEFFAHLRGIAQRTQGRLVSVVAAANAKISEDGEWEGRDNPVFQLYKEMFLPPLIQRECDEMIEKLAKGMNVTFDTASLACIYHETGGHPYITRQLCSHIATNHRSRPLSVDQTLVMDNIPSFITRKGDIFKEILDRLDRFFPEEREIFNLIVKGVSNGDDLANQTNQPIDLILRHLLGYQIVEYRDHKYQVKINLLRRWMDCELITTR
ncbi:hypothetical protein QUF64_09140 [Anaerolineales bacterium HSG6]|nr:hypothetical protein [Anaerolineales bacterium HSG6]